jgi:hypothetical protein
MEIKDRNRIATGNGHPGHLIRPKGSRERSNCPLHIDFKMKRPVHETPRNPRRVTAMSRILRDGVQSPKVDATFVDEASRIPLPGVILKGSVSYPTK